MLRRELGVEVITPDMVKDKDYIEIIEYVFQLFEHFTKVVC